MKFVNGFEEATLRYLDGPTAIHYIWHRYKKKDGSAGNRVGAVSNHYYLMHILGKPDYDIYDEHISLYSFKKMIKGSHSVTGMMPDTSSISVNKIFWDIDPPDVIKTDDKKKTEWQRQKFNKLQEFREEIPCRLYATGNGYAVIVDLMEETDLQTVYDLQKEIDKIYSLGMDTYVPITKLRVFKLPYTKNSKNDLWVLPILPDTRFEDIWRMQRYFDMHSRARYLFKFPIHLDTLKQTAEKQRLRNETD